MTEGKNTLRIIDSGYTKICQICNIRHGSGPTGDRYLTIEPCEDHLLTEAKRRNGIISTSLSIRGISEYQDKKQRRKRNAEYISTALERHRAGKLASSKVKSRRTPTQEV